MYNVNSLDVIPAKAGIQDRVLYLLEKDKIY